MNKITIWLENQKQLEIDFNNYLKKSQLKKEEETKLLLKSHFNKSKKNIYFAIKVFEKFKEDYEWVIISSYYAAYHAALSLLIKKGYSSKSHLATICGLIKYYYKNSINKEDIDNLNFLNKNSISNLNNLKENREIASYGVSKEFEKNLTSSLIKKSQEFIFKVEEILEDDLE